MANINEPNLDLAYGWNLGEDNWNIGMDLNMIIIGGISRHSVISRTTTADPASPSDGDVYYVPVGGTGLWTSKDNNIAIWADFEGAWTFVPVLLNWQFRVEDESNIEVYFNGAVLVNAVDTTGFLTASSTYTSTGDIEYQGAITWTGAHTANVQEIAIIQDVDDAITAQDFSGFVLTTTSQSISGTKTFNSPVVGANATAANEFATLGQVNTLSSAFDAANVGGFAGLFRDKVGDDLNFKSLQSTSSEITIVQNADDIEFQFSGTLGVDEFVDLTDTPANFTGAANKMVVVNGGESALVYIDQPVVGVSEFISLTDAPSSYASQSGNLVAVNGAEDAVEFITPFDELFISLTDTPNIYTGQADFLLRVNATEDGVSFDNITIPQDFVDLGDTPSTYVGQATKMAVVNAGETALEFIDQAAAGIDEFRELIDTPANYVGAAGQTVKVNLAENGLEFQDPTFLALTDTPADYIGQADKVLTINALEDGIEFIDATEGLETWSPTTLSPPLIVDTDFGNTTIVNNGNGNTLSNTSLVDPQLGHAYLAVIGLNEFQIDATDRGLYYSPQNELFNAATGGSFLAACSDGNPFTGTPPATFAFGVSFGNTASNVWTVSSLTGVDSSTYMATDAEVVTGNVAVTYAWDGTSVTMKVFLDNDASPKLTLVELGASIGFSGQVATLGGSYQASNAINTSFFSVETPASPYAAVTQLASAPIIDPASYPSPRTDSAFIIIGLGADVGSVLGTVYDGVLFAFDGSDDPASRSSKRETFDPTATNEITGDTEFSGTTDITGSINVDGNLLAAISTDFTEVNDNVEGDFTAVAGAKYIDVTTTATIGTIDMPSAMGVSFEVDFYKALSLGAVETDGYQLDSSSGNWFINGVTTGSNIYVPVIGEYVKAIWNNEDSRWNIVSFKTPEFDGWTQLSGSGTTGVNGNNLGKFASNSSNRGFNVNNSDASFGDEFKIMNNIGTFGTNDVVVIQNSVSMQMSGRTLTNQLNIRSGQILSGVFDGTIWQVEISDGSPTFQEFSSIQTVPVGRNYYFDGGVTTGAVSIFNNGGNAGQSSFVFFEAGGATINSESITAGDIFMVVIDDGGVVHTKNLTASGGGGGIGGTVGVVTDFIPVADGTGGSTLKASVVSLNSSGTFFTASNMNFAPNLNASFSNINGNWLTATRVSGDTNIVLTAANSGTMELNKDPTTNLGIATKQYADSIFDNTSLASYTAAAGIGLTSASGSDIVLTAVGVGIISITGSEHLNINCSGGVNIRDGLSTIDFDRSNASIDISTQNLGDGEISINAGLPLKLEAGTDITMTVPATGELLSSLQTSAMNSGAPTVLALATKGFVDDEIEAPTFTSPPIFPEHTVAGVPTASSFDNGVIIVSDETGGRTLATSDGTNWRRVADGAIVS